MDKPMNKKIPKYLSSILCLAVSICLSLSGCSNSEGAPSGDTQSQGTQEEVSQSPTSDHPGSQEQVSQTQENTEPTAADPSLFEKPDTDEYVKLALNVYYNDSTHDYYANEAGVPIYVTEDGQYTLEFDCGTDLSDEAVSAGISSLTDLTAIYILDMGVAEGNQSPISSCNILFDSVCVDGTELTITQTEPKSALKSSGVFDTNDPINAWDGSQVAEVSAGSDHVANFTTIKNPNKISVTFTLSDISWGEISENTGAGLTSGAGSSYVNKSVFSDIDFTDIDALTFTKYMGNGINLGNTMEAYGRDTLGTGASVSLYETFWGQPVTTAEMIRGMKDCGFDSLRIPVAWTNMMDWDSGDYTIDKAYLDRVEEIVGYALDAEMFVIINDHWDGGWWAKFGSSDSKSADEAFEMYESMWNQIATRFKDYGDMLIFESANEELGNGLNNNSEWTDSGSLSQAQCYELTNKINQRFVDLVRNSGGNNDDRFLLIAGYNTDIVKTCSESFKMPDDSAKNKLLLSVHYYTPWNYCGSGKNARWGIKKDYTEMNDLFSKLTKFTEKGYGVIIGEYAALPYWVDGKSNLKDNTTEFTKNLLDNCDKYNYVPMLWSCNDLYLKDSMTMADPGLLDLFTERCYFEEKNAGEGYLDSVDESMKNAIENAPDMCDDVKTVEEGTPMAWIMWNGGAGTYSVGDIYNPADNTEGITAHDVEVTGEGEYSVSLDFAGGNTGLTFAALGLAYGETLYPGCILNITEVLIDGEKVNLTSLPYTNSDDGICTRVNLYNGWVDELPADARNISGNLAMSSPTPLDKTLLNDIKNITVKFKLILD